MAEAALCQLWGAVVPGREKEALNVYNETMQYWAGLQQEGKIERFEVTVLAPSGGEVTGFLVARGTAGQIDSLRRTKEYQQRVARVQLVVSHLSVADAYVDEGLAQIMGQYQEVIEQAG
jgi:fructose/tagatose bisphosphate aldolase